MAMNYNPSGPWYSCNFYSAPNQFPLPGVPFRFLGGQSINKQITEEDHNRSSSSQSPEFQYQSSPRRQRIDLLCESVHEYIVLSKAMTLKVLSQLNKRDFTVLTLRDDTQEDMQTLIQ